MISVCLASFNGERYIREQLESILRSPKVSEVIISDDGSSDTTLALVAAIADPRIKVLKGPGRGLIRNFEFLLGKAQGDYIFLSDQDDIWLENKVEVMLAHLQAAELVVSDCKVVDAQGQVLNESFFALRHSGPGFIKNLTRNSFLGCCMAFRRSLLAAALPFPGHVPMHDWWLGLLASATGRVTFVDTPLIHYRRHGGNASDTAQRSTAARWQQLSWRFHLLFHVGARLVRCKRLA
ncbi:glycosyltransferase involved in cell wall biosynthesis [Pseudomonas sp. TE3786]